MRVIVLLCLLIGTATFAKERPGAFTIVSPDKKIKVVFSVEAGEAKFTVFRNNVAVVDRSNLGLVTDKGDFSQKLVLNDSKSTQVTDNFKMYHGKRRAVTYQANQSTFYLANSDGKKFEVQFRVSNDGVAFRYNIGDGLNAPYKVLRETTAFTFPNGATSILQPMSEPKTGWSRVNPCYEEFYKNETPIAATPASPAGWVYPSLFHSGKNWMSLTEAGLRPDYCGSRLVFNAKENRYEIAFPDAREAFTGREFLPSSSSAMSTPWRVVVIGDLNTIIESNLGVALADPAVKMDTSFIRPGHASWSWALLKDDSTVYDVQKRFVDYAADMGWDYCLVDADWDRKIGYGRLAQLSDYAQSKGVGLIVWYNSAGDWNDTPYTPKSKLLTAEQRKSEFALLQKLGIKGVKVDFFGGDGSSMIQYYMDIVKDAADHHLLVNFHGATLPRGWHRTYPNLMSAEAIKGFEYVTFEQVNADEQPRHCTIIPFTRNAVDPMDFTPLSLDSVPNIKRKTSPTFELALSVIFLSGVQHFVEKPSGMKKASPSVKAFLHDLPVAWDETKFISGYPGKDVVIARRSKNTWYVAGINGENVSKTFTVDTKFAGGGSATIFSDVKNISELQSSAVNNSQPLSVKVNGNGGFVIVIESATK